VIVKGYPPAYHRITRSRVPPPARRSTRQFAPLVAGGSGVQNRSDVGTPEGATGAPLFGASVAQTSRDRRELPEPPSTRGRCNRGTLGGRIADSVKGQFDTIDIRMFPTRLAAIRDAPGGDLGRLMARETEAVAPDPLQSVLARGSTAGRMTFAGDRASWQPEREV